MQNKVSGEKKIVLNSVIYSFSGLLTKCFSFFLLPLYTSYLSTEEYGLTNLSTSFLNTMGFIAALSLFSAVMRFYVDLKDNPEQLRRFYGTILLFTFLLCASWIVLIILFRELVSDIVFSGVDFFPIGFVSALSLVFHCVHNIYDNILKSQQKAAKSSILNLIYFFVSIGLNILFVVVFKMGAFGVVLATLISLALYSTYAICDLMKAGAVTWCIDGKLLKSALKYSIPIIPHNLSTHITILISQILIGETSSLGAVGVYSIAAQFGNIADLVQSYINQAYGPWLYEKLHSREDGYKTSIGNIIKVLLAVIVFLLLGIALFAEDYVLLFLENGYSTASFYVPWIVLVFAIKIPYYFYINVLFYYKKAAKMIFTATLSGSFVNILLSSFLIPNYGVYGSIAADAISMLVRVAIVIAISTRFENVGIKLKEFICALVVYAIFAAVGISPSLINFTGEFSITRFVYKVGVVALYAALVAIIYRKKLKSFLLHLKNRR